MKIEYTPTPEESEVIRIMQSEKANWEEGLVWVTDKVQYVTSNVVKKARKNYAGIFNEEKDPVTGRHKIFIPMTEWVVESMLKNIDIDIKDISVKATTPNGYLKAIVFRMLLHKKLNDINFGETLNKWLKRVVIDGTGYLKAYEDDGHLEVGVVDRLNVIADPSVEKLDQSTGIIERVVLNKYEFDELKLENGDYVEGTSTIDKTAVDVVSTGGSTSEIPYVELFIRTGFFPLFVKTGKEDDKNKYFFGKAYVSGLNGSPVFHSIEELDDDETHEYCQGRLKEMPNRLDGRGVPEMLFNIQAYVNEVVNYRMNKARIVQLGLFKMRGNVTPQQFKRLFQTSGIKLDNNSDIEPMNTGFIDPSSYNDEQNAYMWASRVTGTTNEDEIAPSKPATNAMIQEQGAGKGYNLRIEGLMLDLAVFIKKAIIPIIKKELKKDKNKIQRITGDKDIIEKLDREFVKNAVYKKINAMQPFEKEQMAMNGVNPEQIVDQAVKGMSEQMGTDRYIPVIDELFDTDYDVEVTITDESINKVALAKMLQDTIGLLSSSGLPIRNTVRELYDTLGLNGDLLVQEMPQQAPQQPGMPPQAGGAAPPAQQIAQQGAMPQ